MAVMKGLNVKFHPPMNHLTLTRRRLIVLTITVVAVVGLTVLGVQHYRYVSWLSSERQRLLDVTSTHAKEITRLKSQVAEEKTNSDFWAGQYIQSLAADRQSSPSTQPLRAQSPQRLDFQCRFNAFGKLDCTSW